MYSRGGRGLRGVCGLREGVVSTGGAGLRGAALFAAVAYQNQMSLAARSPGRVSVSMCAMQNRWRRARPIH